MRRALPLSLAALLALPLAGPFAYAQNAQQNTTTIVVPNQAPAEQTAPVQAQTPVQPAQPVAPVQPAPVQSAAPQPVAPAQPEAPAQGVPVQAAPAESVPPPGVARQEDPNWPGNLQNWDSAPRNVTGNPGEAERRGLTGPDIQQSQEPQPTEQGTRSPQVFEKEAEEGIDLYTLLSRVRSAPPSLAGQPTPRPNPLASEPETEMQPAQPREAYLFPENYIE